MREGLGERDWEGGTGRQGGRDCEGGTGREGL